jgi:UDP-N-acetylmuramoyl-tripeptide--D-alanyl-D-alanine ligase
VSSDSALLVSALHQHSQAVTRIIYYGTGVDDLRSSVAVHDTEFLTILTSDGTTIRTNLVGRYNFDNAMAAICIGKYFGVPIADIKSAMENYLPSNNRSQKVVIGTNTILLDAYNANPSSMTEALKNFGSAAGAENEITILGEMMELGDYSHAEHLKIIDIVSRMKLTQRIFVGDGFHMLKGREGVLYFENTELLKDWYRSQHFEHTTQLIKGSRKNGLERIIVQ